MFAALDFLRKGQHRGAKYPFQCQLYTEAYDSNIFQLHDIEKRFPDGYHALMRKLYDDVVVPGPRAVQTDKPAYTSLSQTDIEGVNLA